MPGVLNPKRMLGHLRGGTPRPYHGAMAGTPAEIRRILARRFPRQVETVRSRLYGEMYTAQVFRRIYRRRLWSKSESVSGTGSSFERTAAVRASLPGLLTELGCRSLLDGPCGDGSWISSIDLPVEEYTGVDIVPELIERNQRLHARPGRRFLSADLRSDDLPKADLVLCRDCLIHLPLEDGLRVLRNLRRTGAGWLLVSHYPDVTENLEVVTGDHRQRNLRLPPFGLPAPQWAITESPGRELALWPFRDLPF